MTPVYRSQGNAKHYATPGYKRTSTLGGAFETTRIIARIGLVPAVGLLAFLVVVVTLIALVSPAASDAPASQQIASTFEARAGGKGRP
jgi:hypothetical protein